MTTLPHDLYPKLIAALRLNAATYQSIMTTTTQEAASTYRDGGDGWTALEALGHVLDFDEIFHNRAKRILTEASPELVPQNHEQLVIDRAHNTRDKDELAAALVASRTAFADFFETVGEGDWSRAGVHPERELPFTLADAILQAVTHDATHLEQITRILAEQQS